MCGRRGEGEVPFLAASSDTRQTAEGRRDEEGGGGDISVDQY